MKHAIFGHVKSGTTCLAQCMINAGVDFGNNLNIANEDNRLIPLDYELRSRGWTDKAKATRDEIYKDVEGFKHPWAGRYLDGWGELKAICTVRSPQSWIIKMTGYAAINAAVALNKKNYNPSYYEQMGERWAYYYKPIITTDIPLVFLGDKDFEGQIVLAFKKIGLEYKGGYDPKKMHIETMDTWIPKSAEIYGLLRKHKLTG